MLTGAHVVIQSEDAAADRAFLVDVLKLTRVDAGGGYLILGLPSAEASVHPGGGGGHELYFMCDDVEAFIAEMQRSGARCDPVRDEGWGRLTRLTLPSGQKIQVYEPRYERPHAMATNTVRKVRRPARKRAA